MSGGRERSHGVASSIACESRLCDGDEQGAERQQKAVHGLSTGPLRRETRRSYLCGHKPPHHHRSNNPPRRTTDMPSHHATDPATVVRLQRRQVGRATYTSRRPPRTPHPERRRRPPRAAATATPSRLGGRRQPVTSSSCGRQRMRGAAPSGPWGSRPTSGDAVLSGARFQMSVCPPVRPW